jgi:hypothetical protein
LKRPILQGFCSAIATRDFWIGLLPAETGIWSRNRQLGNLSDYTEHLIDRGVYPEDIRM